MRKFYDEKEGCHGIFSLQLANNARFGGAE